MKRLLMSGIISLSMLIFGATMLTPVTSVSAQTAPTPGASCTLPKSSFFGVPTWYAYLEGETDPITKKCSPKLDISNKGFISLLPIGLAVIDILLRAAGVVAVGFIIYAGVQYIISQGEPDGTTKAKDGIINAIIGLGIVMVASVAISFIGSRLQ